MNYNKAIKLLTPYHDAKLIWLIPDSPANAPTGQLTTGLPDMPIIPVDGGNVCADDLYTILDRHAQIAHTTPTMPQLAVAYVPAYAYN